MVMIAYTVWVITSGHTGNLYTQPLSFTFEFPQDVTFLE